MKRLDKYLGLEFLKVYILSALALTVIGLTGVLSDDLNDYLRSGYSLASALRAFLWMVPGIYVQFSPPAVLVAVLITLGLMGKYQETLVLEASGLSPLRFLCPFLGVSLMLSLGTFLVNERVVPVSYNQFKQETEIRKPFLALPAFFLYADVYRVKKDLFENSTILFFYPDGRLKEVYQAKQSWIGKDGKWQMKIGSRTVFAASGQSAYKDSFENLAAEFGLVREDLQPFLRPLEMLNLRQLSDYLKKLAKAGVSPANVRTAYFSRFSTPLLNLVVVFLALPLVLIRTRSRPILIITGICLAVFTYWFYSLSLALGKEGYITPILAAFLPHLIILGVAGLFLYARS